MSPSFRGEEEITHDTPHGKGRMMISISLKVQHKLLQRHNKKSEHKNTASRIKEGEGHIEGGFTLGFNSGRYLWGCNT
jgi:hypothetical protein